MFKITFCGFVICYFCIIRHVEPCYKKEVQAVCSMQGNSNRPKTGIRGVVLLTQSIDECSGSVGPLLIKTDVAGFPHDGRIAYYGFHVHEMSDFSDGCESFGPHYNPYQNVHGGPKDHLGRKHLGDLGNIVKNPIGFVQGVTKDIFLSMFGPLSIRGRGIVIHENPDDFGRGGNEQSLITGNSGGRLACCKIVPIY